MTKKDLWVESFALFFPFFFFINSFNEVLSIYKEWHMFNVYNLSLDMCKHSLYSHHKQGNRHIQQLNFSMFLCLFGFFFLFVVRMLNIFLIIEQKVRCRPIDVTRQSKEQKRLLLINENKTVYLFPFLLSSFIHSLINSFRYLLCSYYVP